MPAAPVEDEDTKAAVVAYAQIDQDLRAAIPGGWHDGPVPSTTTGTAAAQTFAKIACTQGPKPNQYIAPLQPGQGYHDFRKFTLTITGIKASVVSAVGLLRGLFDWQPRETLDSRGDARRPMTVGNARLMHVMPLPGSPRIEDAKSRVQGQPIWNGVLEYEVWTARVIV